MKDWLKRGISLVLIASMATSCLQPYVFAAELAQSSAEIVAEAAADAEESLTEVEEEGESEDENAEETEEEAEEADEAEEAPEEDTADEAIEAINSYKSQTDGKTSIPRNNEALAHMQLKST